MAMKRSSNSSEWKAELLFRVHTGIWRTFRWAADRLLDKHFDRRFGIESAERRQAEESDAHSSDFEQHQAVSYTDMRQLLDRLTIHPEDVFLDYGSGMGRAVCLAATCRFRSVLGVEISSEFCKIALRNIERVQSKLRCKDVRIVNENALTYEVPDDVSMIFFHNPFGGAALGAVLENVENSIRKSQRSLQLIFHGTLSTNRFRAEAAKRDWLALESETVLKTGALVLLYVNHS
jgi:cyclopropane fatty-acyl-phospholipid synthase-like methyltransferase